MPSIVKCIIYEARVFPLVPHKTIPKETQVEIRWATLQQVYKTKYRGPNGHLHHHHPALEKSSSSPPHNQQLSNNGLHTKATGLQSAGHSVLRWDEDFRFEILDDDLLLQSPIELRVSDPT